MLEIKIEKKFVYKGITCVVVGVRIGHRCGYVGLQNPPKSITDDPYSLDLDVHGGITYSRYSKNYPINTSTTKFWLGFDCAHYSDGKDMTLVKELNYKVVYEKILKTEQMFGDSYEHVWTTEEVIQELKNLVDKLVELGVN